MWTYQITLKSMLGCIPFSAIQGYAKLKLFLSRPLSYIGEAEQQLHSFLSLYQMQVRDQLLALAALPPRKECWYPLTRGLCEHPRASLSILEDKTSYPFHKSNQHAAQSLHKFHHHCSTALRSNPGLCNEKPLTNHLTCTEAGKTETCDPSEHNITILDRRQFYIHCNIVVSSTSVLEVWLYYLPLLELVLMCQKCMAAICQQVLNNF